MRSYYRVLRCLLIASLLAATVNAQPEPQPLPRPGPLRFYHQEAENLSQTHAILQDHEGFMWFGSASNLYRYDGHTYSQFAHDPYDSLSIAGGRVSALFEDSQHVLWVGTTRGGLNRFDRQTETFRRFQHDPDNPASLSSNNVWALLEDRRGILWVRTYGGLNRFDRQTESFTRFHTNAEEPQSVESLVGALHEDRNGAFWVGSWGLNRFDRETETFTRYLPEPAIEEPDPGDPYASANWVSAIHEDPRGRLWVGTTGGGLYRFDRAAETFTVYRNDPARVGDGGNDLIRAIVDDPAGGLWLATKREGLVWFDPETGAMTAYRHDALDPHSLSGDYVLSLYEDQQGVFWVGTWWRDVDRFDRAVRPFVHYYARPGGDGGLVYPHVQTMAEAPDGVLWVINGDGSRDEAVLTRIDREAGTYRHFRHDPNDPRSLSLNAFSVFVDASGMLWIGDFGGVLSRMDPERPGRFTHFRHDPDDESSLPPGIIQSLYEDTQGRLWVGSRNLGISRMDDRDRGVFTRFPLGDNIDGDIGRVDNIFEDGGGMLWVGTSRRGLFRFNPETGTIVNYSHDPDDANSLAGNNIFGIYERPQEPGVLWLGVYPFGLGRFEPETGSFRLYTTEDGLPDNGAQGVLGDEQGRLWTGTDVGLSRFDPDTGVFTNYDVDDGLQGESFNAWSYHKGRSGMLYFGGPQGFNAFYPEEVRDNPHPPQVALTTLRLGRQVVTPDPDGPLTQRLAETAALTLTHRQNDLTLEYVGLHFRHSEKNRYQYLLEGYDKAWSEETLVRQATYTNLPPGDYTFRVKASNSDGVWNEAGASLKITILPPWWRTTWAYVLYGLLFVAGVVGVDRVQRRRLIARERQRAEVAQERLRAEAAERELEQAREIEKAHIDLQQAHAHLKTTQKQLIQSEKMASLGALTAGIAHEIKNPLNFITGFAEVNEELADELREAWHNGTTDVDDLLADLKQNAQVINQHGKRADAIVRSMMQHASGGTGQREATDVNALLEEYVNLAYHGKRAQTPGLNVEIDRDYGEAVGKIPIVPQEIGRVLLNLLSNAFDAVQETEEPRVKVSTRLLDGQVEIRVSDNGAGIPKEIKDRIFEPFFTTKPTGSGTGLGLSLAYDIVTQGHGGTLTVESTEGEGATFVITLPMNSPNTG